MTDDGYDPYAEGYVPDWMTDDGYDPYAYDYSDVWADDGYALDWD